MRSCGVYKSNEIIKEGKLRLHCLCWVEEMCIRDVKRFGQGTGICIILIFIIFFVYVSSIHDA